MYIAIFGYATLTGAEKHCKPLLLVHSVALQFMFLTSVTFELLDFVTKYIPESEPVVCVPQEDPFYVMTGRRNPLPMVIFDRTATPLSPEEIVEEAERRQVKWVIVKRVLQFGGLAGETKGLPEVFSEKYSRVARLKGYDILYRSAPAQVDSP